MRKTELTREERKLRKAYAVSIVVWAAVLLAVIVRAAVGN